MDFKDQVALLANRAMKQKDQIETEEATKTGLVLPFLQCLGYDVFNPSEVVPEFVADVGIKKGEKVDYAIIKDGKPIIIIECKWWGDPLTAHKTQLLRYFNVTAAKFAILTNGIVYQLFTDLEENNKMDEKPFLEFDITQMTEPLIEELKKFHKSYFNVEIILNTASELMYSNEIRKILTNEFLDPSVEFVKYLARPIYPGKVTDKVITIFTSIVKKSLNNFISDKVNEKIKAALESSPIKDVTEKGDTPTIVEDDPPGKTKQVVTSESEFEGLAYVKVILQSKGVDINRISYKDTVNYFAVILDSSTWKTVCRLWLNQKKMYIGLFGTDKKETKYELTSLNDIFKYGDQLFEMIRYYDNEKSS